MKGLNCGRALYRGSICPRGRTCGGRPNSLRGIGDWVAGGEAGEEALPALLSASGLAGSAVVVGASVEEGDGSAGAPGVELSMLGTGAASAGCG